jgi:phytoene dehydrogenase-like protein
MVRDGRVTGVALENGDEFNANVVVSGLDPKRTFLSLVDRSELPERFVSDIERFRIRGSSGKVNLSLSALPDYTCLPGEGPHHRGAISISPSIEYLERAYDDAKYGEFSRRPYMDTIFPSVIDPSMAPPGKHVMSCFVQYAPFKLNGGWTPEKKESFGDAVVDAITEYAPDFKSIILHRQVVTPDDLESVFGLTEGNIFHGELALHQLFMMRPTAEWAKYDTPIKGYYQCGSGTHPGGGITGQPGRLAALRILRKRK